MADEASDCGHYEQISVIVRFYDKSLNKPVEYFICMQCLIAVEAQSIFNSLDGIVVN